MSQSWWLLPTLLAPVEPSKRPSDVTQDLSHAGMAGLLTRAGTLKEIEHLSRVPIACTHNIRFLILSC